MKESKLLKLIEKAAINKKIYISYCLDDDKIIISYCKVKRNHKIISEKIEIKNIDVFSYSDGD